MYHYVYRITNTQLNKHYYGSRTSKILPKEDLGIHYFSSSTDKDFIKEQICNKNNFKYKVIKVFNNRADANMLEVILHKKLNVAVNDSFYNRVNQTSHFFSPSHFSTTKSIITRTNTIEENGESIMTNNGRKASKTRMSTITENGLTIQEQLTKKTVKTKYLTDDDGVTTHKKASIKTKKTMIEKGLYKAVGEKSKMTKFNTIDSNGDNIYDLASKKSVITKKTTIIEDNMTIQERATKRSIETKRNTGLFKDIYEKCTNTKKQRVDEYGISDFDKQYIKMKKTKYDNAVKYDVYDKYDNIIQKGLTKQMISELYSRSLIKTDYNKRLGSTPSARAVLIKNNKGHLIDMYVKIKENNVSND